MRLDLRILLFPDLMDNIDSHCVASMVKTRRQVDMAQRGQLSIDKGLTLSMAGLVNTLSPHGLLTNYL